MLQGIHTREHAGICACTGTRNLWQGNAALKGYLLAPLLRAAGALTWYGPDAPSPGRGPLSMGSERTRTTSGLPSSILPFMAVAATLAVSASSKCTNPKPRDWPCEEERKERGGKKGGGGVINVEGTVSCA